MPFPRHAVACQTTLGASEAEAGMSIPLNLEAHCVSHSIRY